MEFKKAIEEESKKRKWNELVEDIATTQLPSDVVIQIVSRLPVKSILRFKSVSKAWYTLLTSPNFARSYLHTASNISCMMVQAHKHNEEESVEIRVVESLYDHNPVVRDLVPPFSTGPNSELVGSINGLLCLSLGASSFVLWNPATGKHFRIPSPITSATMVDAVCIGFAYDEETENYKVVRVISSRFKSISGGTGSSATIEIYNSGTNTWRLHELDSLPLVHCQVACGSIFRGAPYWFEKDFNNPGNKAFLMHFDPSDEKLRLKYVDIPFEDEEHRRFKRIGIGFEGDKPILFGLKLLEPRKLGSILKTWRMDKDCVLVEKTTVDVGFFLQKVLGIWRNGETIGLKDDGELVMYDHEIEEPTYLPLNLLHSIYYYAIAKACEYTPSLVLPSYPSA